MGCRCDRLASLGCGAAFFGAGYVQGSRSVSLPGTAPLGFAAAVVTSLVVYEYRSSQPLRPVKQLATTLPVMGVLIAMFSSAAPFGLLELVLAVLARCSARTLRLGTTDAICICFALAATGWLVATGLFVLGGWDCRSRTSQDGGRRARRPGRRRPCSRVATGRRLPQVRVASRCHRGAMQNLHNVAPLRRSPH